MAQRDLAAVGERASEKQDRLGALCSSVWSTPELLITFLLGRWLGSQGSPCFGNPFRMASVAHSLLVHNINGIESYQEADRYPKRMVGVGGRQGTIRPGLDLTLWDSMVSAGGLAYSAGFWRWGLRRVEVRGCFDGQ